MKKHLLMLCISLLVLSCKSNKAIQKEDINFLESLQQKRWSQKKAWEWYNQYPWLAGTNFNPSTAINQLEFFQADTYDRETIDRELSWSADLGMNVHRVYLHNLLWTQDKDGFLKRVDDFLSMADKHDIKIMLVLLDDVWHPVPKLGKQPEPIPHVHNSGWVQAPGSAILGDLERHDELKPYIKGVINQFAHDERVIAWDLYNEPDNVPGQPDRKALDVPNKAFYSYALLKKVFAWAREVNPSQPISSSIWKNNPEHWGTIDSMTVIDKFMVTQSDFINFHAYDDIEGVKLKVNELKKFGRPLICTEYLARGHGNRFDNVMQLFHDEKIGAINWGFVAGKTQTQYPWASWDLGYPKEEPEIWHHEVLRKDGTPYSNSEVKLIKQLTGKIPSVENDYPIKPIGFTEVNINDKFWKPRMETNRKVTIRYDFDKCEETGRISNFSKAGDLEEGEFEGIFFNDSDVFKVIEGASYSLMVNDDPELDGYLDSLIEKIAAAQEDDGYLYTNRTIDPAKAADGGGEQRWTNLKIHHELYNVGHMYEAAVAHFQATGKKSLLDVALKNANLINEVFGPGKNMGVPGHQEIEIGLVKLFRLTGEKKYLDLAKFFVDERGNKDGHDLFGKYAQDHKRLWDQSEAVGHAVRACYYYAGATDVAALTDSDQYDEALDKIWKDIVHQKIYLTGGIGAEPKHEGFGPDYELPNATAYTETCAAIALMLWNHRMFLKTGESKYMDVFERTLYNGFLAGVSFEGNTFFYPNPLEADGTHKFNQGVCGRSPWFDCSCCPVNVVRILPSIPGYVYSVKDKDVYVNLYIGNEATFDVGHRTLKIKQETNYPWDGKVKLTIQNKAKLEAGFKLRLPGWNSNRVMDGDLYSYVDNHNPNYTVSVNGNQLNPSSENGYLSLAQQEWNLGDVIELNFDMPVRKVKSHDSVKANTGKIAFERGPIVFCSEEIDNKSGVLNMRIDPEIEMSFQYDNTLFNGTGTISGGSVKAVPYYAWAHREIGEMAVWLKTK